MIGVYGFYESIVIVTLIFIYIMLSYNYIDEEKHIGIRGYIYISICYFLGLLWLSV